MFLIFLDDRFQHQKCSNKNNQAKLQNGTNGSPSKRPRKSPPTNGNSSEDQS